MFTGRCTSQERRWYFDYRTQSCNEFVYTGCNGNANNFESRRECENRCQVGACCFRWPAFPEIPIGYDYQGYDKCVIVFILAYLGFYNTI